MGLARRPRLREAMQVTRDIDDRVWLRFGGLKGVMPVETRENLGDVEADECILETASHNINELSKQRSQWKHAAVLPPSNPPLSQLP
jgi:hypothetical protein